MCEPEQTLPFMAVPGRGAGGAGLVLPDVVCSGHGGRGGGNGNGNDAMGGPHELQHTRGMPDPLHGQPPVDPIFCKSVNALPNRERRGGHGWVSGLRRRCSVRQVAPSWRVLRVSCPKKFARQLASAGGLVDILRPLRQRPPGSIQGLHEGDHPGKGTLWTRSDPVNPATNPRAPCGHWHVGSTLCRRVLPVDSPAPVCTFDPGTPRALRLVLAAFGRRAGYKQQTWESVKFLKNQLSVSLSDSSHAESPQSHDGGWMGGGEAVLPPRTQARRANGAADSCPLGSAAHGLPIYKKYKKAPARPLPPAPVGGGRPSTRRRRHRCGPSWRDRLLVPDRRLSVDVVGSLTLLGARV